MIPARPSEPTGHSEVSICNDGDPCTDDQMPGSECDHRVLRCAQMLRMKLDCDCGGGPCEPRFLDPGFLPNLRVLNRLSISFKPGTDLEHVEKLVRDTLGGRVLDRDRHRGRCFEYEVEVPARSQEELDRIIQKAIQDPQVDCAIGEPGMVFD